LSRSGAHFGTYHPPCRLHRPPSQQFAIADKLRPRGRVYPQDLRFFWRALGEIGVGEQPSVPRSSAREQMREVLRRVRPIIDGLQTGFRG
jgi:hypothetical protein